MESDSSSANNSTLYALSTCIWCKKTKKLLASLGQSYQSFDLDRFSGREREDVNAKLLRWNPVGSVPTLVIDDEHCIIGYDEQAIRNAFSPHHQAIS